MRPPHPLILSVFCLMSITSCGSSSSGTGISAGPADDSRVTARSEIFSLSTPKPTPGLIGGDSVDFVYVADIASPAGASTTAGVPVQATSLSMNAANQVAVVYNMAGPSVGGALEIIDFSTPSKPSIKSTLIYKTEDFTDVILGNGVAYVTGGDDINGALLKTFKIDSKGVATETYSTTVQGYMGVALALNGNILSVITGNNGGVYQYNVQNPASPVALGTYSINDATDAFYFQSGLYVLGVNSQPGIFALNTAGSGSFSLAAVFSSGLDAAPARAVVDGNFVVTTASSNQLGVYSQNHAGTFSSVGATALQGDGNGLAAVNNAAFLAQGYVGLEWADLYGSMNPAPTWSNLPKGVTAPANPSVSPVIRGVFEFVNDPGSANQVLYAEINKKPWWLMADGERGLRWFRQKLRKHLKASMTYSPAAEYDDERLVAMTESFKIPSTLDV